MEECTVCGRTVEFCPSCYHCQAPVCGPDCLTAHRVCHLQEED